MPESSVDRLVREHRDLREHLLEAGELSYASQVDASFRKVLLLAAASLFEHRITTILLEFISEASSGNTCVVGIVRNKAIARQYHTYFDWKNLSAAPFYAAFGEAKASVQAEIGARNLAEAVRAFMRLGGLRNDLVHQDYADFLLDLTVEDIYAMYTEGDKFVNELPGVLMAASRSN